MKRYFFHVNNHEGSATDCEGTLLASPEAARTHAIEAIRSILSEEAGRGLIDLTGRIEVANDDGACLFTTPYEEAVEVRLNDRSHHG